ncbi:SAC3/GANP family protein, putative [Babesia bigemina]|uniref:SAC3/GANP family protein, putative n=1 Tax=Babesia bigemina TaxID=5866 RepID=A0A061DDD3_BABBI|nr:SAC3/GANP family protein, putative [Babesia bigemina]CDR97289.1 SAC3/GANP family protein, putative [Babesia bigemina]|eukprot:XP_012769475.1 SAC3/GANP family protein, putative [Babesia bigemina]
MTCNPPDYLSIADRDGSAPASRTLRNQLLRPLEGSELGATILKHQEVASFLRGKQTGRMVGEVLGMCPAKEIKQKLEMNTASDLERICSTKVNPRLALKSFQRSDASRVFKPEETRPAVWCRRTIFNILCYFVDADLVQKPYLMPKKFSYLDVYNFLRDRLRSIWQDLTVQHCTKHRAYIECFEISIRFLIYSNEQLCENEEYDIAQNRGLLNTCLDKLMEGYEAVHKYKNARKSKRQMEQQSGANPNFDEVMDILVYQSPHEAEFWGYRLLLHIPQLLLPGGSATFCDIKQRMPESLRESPVVAFAVEVCHTAASRNLYRYFTLLRREDCPALYAALMNRFAACLRVQFLETLVVYKVAKKGVNPMDMETFNSIFGFDGEPAASAEKLFKKYDITVYSSGDKQFLEFEGANANQLTYDSAALQKLTNKFQTTSSVVGSKLASFASRQLIFDPDFEYPEGLGPDTPGTPYVEEIPPKPEPPAAPVEPPQPKFTFGKSSFAGFPPVSAPIGGGLPAVGSGFDPPATSKVAFSFGQLQGAPESKPFSIFGFGAQASEPKPFAFGPPPTAPDQKIFGFGPGAATPANNTNPFASSFPTPGMPPPAPSQPLLTQTAATTPSNDVKPFTFGATPEPKPKFTFGAAPAAAEQASDKAVPAPPGNTGSVGTPPKSARLRMPPSSGIRASTLPAESGSNANAVSGDSTCEPGEKSSKSAFGLQPPPSEDKATPKPLFSFTVNSFFGNETEPTLFKPPITAAAGKDANKEAAPAAATPGVIDEVKALFGITDPKPAFPNLFGKQTTDAAAPQLPLFGNIQPTPTADPPSAANVPQPSAPSEEVESHESAQSEDEPEDIYSLERVIEAYENAKAVKRVKLIRPKLPGDVNSMRIEGAVQMSADKRLLHHLRDLVGSLVDRTVTGAMLDRRLHNQFDDPIALCGLDEPARKRYRRSVRSPSSDANVSHVDAYGASPTSSRRDLGEVKGLSARLTPVDGIMSEGGVRDRAAHRCVEVLYLNRRGSERFLVKAYIKHLVDHGVRSIIKPCYTCESCWSNNGYDMRDVLKMLGSSTVQITKGVYRLARFIVRHASRATVKVVKYVHKRLRDSRGDDSETDVPYSPPLMHCDGVGHLDLAVVTERALKDMAISTSSRALATGKYLAGVYGSSSRLAHRFADCFKESLNSDASPLELLLRVAIKRLDFIVGSTTANMHDSLGYQAPLHTYSVWGTGISFHVAFFDPLLVRSELLASSPSGSKGRDLTAEGPLGRLIEEYHSSDYCLRLKQDVLHMSGFEIGADRLFLGGCASRRLAMQCCSASPLQTRKDSDPEKTALPLTVAVSLNLRDDGFGIQREVRFTPCSREHTVSSLSHGLQTSGPHDGDVNGATVAVDYRLCHRFEVIHPDDPRYHNTVSIALYAHSCPVYIGKEGLLHELFTCAVMPDLPTVAVGASGIDSYGVLSTLMHASGPEIGGQYRTCVVCYRLSVSTLDLLTLYEYFNTSLPNTVSVCGCAEKNRETCATRLEQVLSSVEEQMLAEVIRYASSVGVPVDASLMRTRIVFACVGFEQHYDEQSASKAICPKCREPDTPRGREATSQDNIALPNHGNEVSNNTGFQSVIRIPRMTYPEGFRRGLEMAADATVKSQAVFVLQNPFAIPDIHTFLLRLLKSSQSGAEGLSTDLPGMLTACLDRTISHVTSHFAVSHWDVNTSAVIQQDVEIPAEFGIDAEPLSRYSKESYMLLLRALQMAATASSGASRKNVKASMAAAEPDNPDALISRVLDKVIVRTYHVPYSIGLYMDTVGSKHSA